jgi:phosphotriesterase-related protein
MSVIRTVGGDVETAALGLVLIHEHLCCDLRPLHGREPVPLPEAAIMAGVTPLLRGAAAAGVTVLAEPTPPGIGREPLLYRRLGAASGLHVVAATGLYKEPLLPGIAYRWTEQQLTAWMVTEIEQGIEGTDARAGFIKLASSDSGLQPVEAKALRAAVSAAHQTGALIVSHSPNGAAALEQLRVLRQAGGDPRRFVQVHAHVEPDFGRHLAVVEQGAWVEYDHIGTRHDDRILDLTLRMLAAGHGEHVLLSGDVVGWQPAIPGGGNTRRYDDLLTSFVPRLRSAGVTGEQITLLLRENPLRALALQPSTRS